MEKTGSEEIRGIVESVVYRNDGNGYTVVELSCEDGKLVTAVGSAPPLSEGETLVLRGEWTYHKEFGRQFAFSSLEENLPADTDGILRYLSSRTVRGVGPVTALKIVNRFGIDTFDVIENHPEWLADIPGITLKKAGDISASFREQTGIRGVMMFCRDYLGTGEVTKVYKQYGAGAVGVIRDNPYVLCAGEFGIGFDKADEIAASIDYPKDSINRIESGLVYVLTFNSRVNGHTCLPREKLISAAMQVLSLPPDTVATTLDRLLDDGRLALFSAGGVDYIMTTEVAEEEDFIARRLNEMNRQIVALTPSDCEMMILKAENENGLRYAEQQRRAIREALTCGMVVITGGPGTGKTTIVKAIISIFESLGMSTVLSAPTGRAAKRLSEATGKEAKTVHRMLEMERGGDGEEVRFNRNKTNPLDEDIIIVDEASMIDLSLMNALLLAVRRGARLVMIGDTDQLPSVGAGNILGDIITSGAVNTVKLTDVFRQASESMIITNAHRINHGEIPILNKVNSDFFFVCRENEKTIPATVLSLITERLPRTYGDGIRDKVQVISPSKKGSGGIEILNHELQEKLNPPSEFKREKNAHGIIFREGDKVMQTVNNYDIEWEKNGAEGTGIFNGDIGIIERIDTQNARMIINFDDRTARYGFDLLGDLELAYAITVHKSQGSEYPVVIVPMYSAPPMLETRNLLYTAVTRAKEMVILVGRSDIPARMVANNREIMRYTTLSYKLAQAN